MLTDAPPHLIVFADDSDVPFLASSLERLPADACGTVFIEVPSAAVIEEIATPQDVAVRWLVNDAHHHGHRLLAAARGWVAEWSIPGETLEQYHLWIGCGASLIAEQLHAEVHAACHHPHE